jgi:hypothetical protein
MADPTESPEPSSPDEEWTNGMNFEDPEETPDPATPEAEAITISDEEPMPWSEPPASLESPSPARPPAREPTAAAPSYAPTTTSSAAPIPTPTTTPLASPTTLPVSLNSPEAVAILRTLEQQVSRMLTHTQETITEMATAIAAKELALARDQMEALRQTMSGHINELEQCREKVQQATKVWQLENQRHIAQTQVAEAHQMLQSLVETATILARAITNDMEKHTGTLEATSRKLTTKLWAGAMGAALFLALGLLLGIAWTQPTALLSEAQHTALYVGTETIREYVKASPERQQDIRRVLRWRDPAE